MRRPTLAPAVALTLALCGTAAAQNPGPPGTLVVMSRPSGASFRLAGESVIIARTPIVLERGLSGRYRLESLEPGYNHWVRTLELNGSTADSVWMTLSRKSAAAAGLRSVVIPGWGQGYSGRPEACAFWLVTGVAAAGTAGYFEHVYRQRSDDLAAAEAAVAASSTPAALAALQQAEDQYADAKRRRRFALGTAGVVWAVNLIDAIARFPVIHAGPISIRLGPAPGGADPGSVALVRARF